jgi:hypothetical protein
MQLLGWTLIYIARGLEWLRLHWNDIAVFGPLGRWTTKPVNASVTLITKPGIVLMWPTSWMYPAAVGLVKLGNRLLPPLDDDEGFLARLRLRMR